MKICLITGSRSEWGLLEPIAQLMDADNDIDFGLIVTGSHTLEEYGETDELIDFQFVWCGISPIKDGYDLCDGFDDVFGQCFRSFYHGKPDAILVLGDRWEIFAAVQAAHLCRIKVIHLHGGEATYGLYDEAFRHCITKMSQLHFPATVKSKKRIEQLGENPKTVFYHGCLGADNAIPQIKKKEQLLVMFHPVTLVDEKEDYLIEVLKKRPEKKIVIGSNADPGGLAISDKLASQEWEFHKSLPREEFIKILSDSKAIVGNSSAGIIEAPARHTPTINIGYRQLGREKASSIIYCLNTKEDIERAFKNLDNNKLSFSDVPYYGQNVAQKIVNTIKSELPKLRMDKVFYDLP